MIGIITEMENKLVIVRSLRWWGKGRFDYEGSTEYLCNDGILLYLSGTGHTYDKMTYILYQCQFPDCDIFL